jgi:hypothetical protein
VTPTDERMRDLLHQAAPETGAVRFEDVARLVRRRQRRTRVASVAAVAIVVGGVAYAGAALRGGDEQPQGVTSAPTPTALAGRSVTFHGIVFSLPAGWRVAKPQCEVQNDAVVEGVWTGFCPARVRTLPVPTGVTLTAVYGPRFALSWPGRRTSWHGQPAWLGEHINDGAATATLTVPWLNAEASTQAPTPAQARALLNQVSVRAATGLVLPQHAASVFIQSLAGHDGDGQNRNATIRSTTDVQRLLSDLRALTPDVAPANACNGSWFPNTALITVRGTDGSSHTYAARFGGCNQITAGTGGAARTSPRLIADIRRLVPNSNL